MSSPSIFAKESSHIGDTLYVNIDLRIIGRRPETGIFIPAGFDGSRGIDIAFYLHGFQQRDGVVSINQYFKKDYGKLREGVFGSGRNVILVAPTLGPRSQAGTLVERGGFDDILNKVVAAIRVHQNLIDLPAGPLVRNLIVAAHSGGGVAERKIAGGNEVFLSKLRESWGYDSLYHDIDIPFWTEWVREHTAGRLLLYYLPNGSNLARRCKALSDLKIPNLIAEGSGALSHMLVPITHWTDCLRGASFLDMRPGLSAPVTTV